MGGALALFGASPPSKMLLQDCINSGNRAACASLLGEHTAHQLARLLFHIAAASAFASNLPEEHRARYRYILREVAAVAYQEFDKKKSPGPATGAFATL